MIRRFIVATTLLATAWAAPALAEEQAAEAPVTTGDLGLRLEQARLLPRSERIESILELEAPAAAILERDLGLDADDREALRTRGVIR